MANNNAAEIAVIRHAFAKQIVAVACVPDNLAVKQAFATIERERFLGTEPWVMFQFGQGKITLPTNDPAYAYQDALFTLDAKRGVNNGVPSLHAKLLDELGVQPGMKIAHMGAGSGYYTAILSHLVGPEGKVTAIEFDAELGKAARKNLREYQNVEVIIGDGSNHPKEQVDRIYVNYALSAPQQKWLEALAQNGCLVMPLGAPNQVSSANDPLFSSKAGAFSFTRCGENFQACHICPVSFVFAEGENMQNEVDHHAALLRAFKSHGIEFVQSLIWQTPADPGRCWFWSEDWSLSYDPVC